ncbi:type 4a pilus biogenesis protein PilO [Naasia sp. SYSU D00948]|uniref:type 4a pilus biogenesis protein PilO n=1 Tax=Naasia sp. SYSU D00948 TaxID=2817379 RepID=UPI001B314A8F|nr:type 4a pilus biogenesis protein PilO [Naasia sp. SYSU D00948]
MNLSRVWIGGGILAVVAVLAGGWLLGVQPMLAVAEDNRAQRASVAALVATQERQLAELQRQAEDRDGLEADVRELRAALPEDTAMPALVGELSQLAAAAGVRVIAFGSNDALALAPADTPGGAEGEDPAAAPGTVAIPVQLTAEGTLDGLLDFVARVQEADRLLLPSGLTFALQEDGGDFQGGLSGYAYASPQP